MLECLGRQFEDCTACGVVFTFEGRWKRLRLPFHGCLKFTIIQGHPCPTGCNGVPGRRSSFRVLRYPDLLFYRPSPWGFEDFFRVSGSPAWNSQECSVGYPDKMYILSSQNLSSIRPQCETVIRVNTRFFPFLLRSSFPPLATSDVSLSLETWVASISEDRSRWRCIPYLFPNDDTAFSHPHGYIVVVYPKSFKEQLILL